LTDKAGDLWRLLGGGGGGEVVSWSRTEISEVAGVVI
jgi:hypothetical protein